MKKVTIEEIENEEVEFEGGIWVFLAKDLRVLRSIFVELLHKIPKNICTKTYIDGKDDLKETLEKGNYQQFLKLLRK